MGTVDSESALHLHIGRESGEIKATTTLPIRYIMNREGKSPSVIPDCQMEDFTAIVATQDEHLEIVGSQDADLTNVDLVRVTSGVFADIKGRYIHRKRHSKVAVAIRNVATTLTAYVPLKYIEKNRITTPIR